MCFLNQTLALAMTGTEVSPLRRCQHEGLLHLLPFHQDQQPALGSLQSLPIHLDPNVHLHKNLLIDRMEKETHANV